MYIGVCPGWWVASLFSSSICHIKWDEFSSSEFPWVKKHWRGFTELDGLTVTAWEVLKSSAVCSTCCWGHYVPCRFVVGCELIPELTVESASSELVWITWTWSMSSTTCWGISTLSDVWSLHLCCCWCFTSCFPIDVLLLHLYLWCSFFGRWFAACIMVVLLWGWRAGGFSSIHSTHFPLRLICLGCNVGFAIQPCHGLELFFKQPTCPPIILSHIKSYFDI